MSHKLDVERCGLGGQHGRQCELHRYLLGVVEAGVVNGWGWLNECMNECTICRNA